MRVGFNYPWYSNTFGDQLFHPGTVDDFAETLARLAPLGVSVVRVWLLCQLDRYEELGGERGARALDTYERLLVACAERDVAMIPSLFSHDAFGEPARSAGNGGRGGILRAESLAAQLFDEALEPFIARSAPYVDQIHSFELMNEPAWNLWGLGPWSHHARAPGVTQSALRRFLLDGLRRIEAAGLPSTVGHARAGDLAQLPPGTEPQFHWYGLPQMRLPSYDATKAFVGEFSSSAANLVGRSPRARPWRVDRWFREATTMPWPELRGADLSDDRSAVLARLRLLRRKGYQLALLWPSLGDGPGWQKLSTGAQDALRQFSR